MHSLFVAQRRIVCVEQLVQSYIFDGWAESALQLQISERDETPFNRQTHEVSIITYGILSKWSSLFDRILHHPLLQYSAFSGVRVCGTAVEASTSVDGMQETIEHMEFSIWPWVDSPAVDTSLAANLRAEF